MIRVLFLAALLAIPGLSATAGDPSDLPVSAEVLPGWVQADGSRVAALHLSLKPGWKTYWRAPGDAGIPPEFDWAGSSNLGAVSISWPTPQVYYQNGMRSIGYTRDLVIPLAISPRRIGDPVRLRVRMDLGVCSDICMPHRLDLDALLDNTGSKPVPVIAAALAQRPYTAGEAGVKSATCRIEPTADGLRIEARIAMPSAGADEVVIIEPGQGDIWVSESETRRSGGEVIAASDLVHVSGGPIALDRSAVRLTVLGSTHAVDVQGCTPG